MADFQTDIHTIQYLVNHSGSKKEALDKFHNTHGFSLSYEQACKALNQAIHDRFDKTETIASILARKYQIAD